MKGVGIIKRVSVVLAVVGLCLPQAVLAGGEVANRSPAVVDVTLKDGGVLLGQVVDPQGAPLAKVPVSLRDRDREVARTMTDSGGYFAVRGLRGGVYQLVAARGCGEFRLWKPGTAPPGSRQGALLVASRETVRGQGCEAASCDAGAGCGCGSGCGSGCGGLSYWLSNPWVVAGIVATAVAVPVAIHNADRPASP